MCCGPDLGCHGYEGQARIQPPAQVLANCCRYSNEAPDVTLGKGNNLTTVHLQGAILHCASHSEPGKTDLRGGADISNTSDGKKILKCALDWWVPLFKLNMHQKVLFAFCEHASKGAISSTFIWQWWLSLSCTKNNSWKCDNVKGMAKLFNFIGLIHYKTTTKQCQKSTIIPQIVTLSVIHIILCKRNEQCSSGPPPRRLSCWCFQQRQTGLLGFTSSELYEVDNHCVEPACCRWWTQSPVLPWLTL